MKSMQSTGSNLPVQLFKDKKDWEAWLGKNHATSAGLWLKIAKKAAKIKSLSYAEALEAALCYGWIDGQKKACDESTWLQKFTPRGPRSIWSTINREKAEELIKQGLVKPAGLKAIERAKENGQWDTAYASQSRITIPVDLQAELDANKKAKAFFATLNSANRYAILFRLQTAKKPETRAKRLRQFIDMLEKHEKLHP
jgi:uncharacterized protein YdeI (YjbR/CyaY-like superfamily)